MNREAYLARSKENSAFISLQEAGPECWPVPAESSTEVGRCSVISDPELICAACCVARGPFPCRAGGTAHGLVAFELSRVFLVTSVIKNQAPCETAGFCVIMIAYKREGCFKSFHLSLSLFAVLFVFDGTGTTPQTHSTWNLNTCIVNLTICQVLYLLKPGHRSL